MRSGRSRRQHYLAVFHRSIGPGQAAAGEHCNADVIRWQITGDAHVVPSRADFGNRDHSYPQSQVEILSDPGSGLRQGTPRQSCVCGRHREARAIAAEYKRDVSGLERIGDRSNHRSACHVYSLISILENCFCRLGYIGHADHPIVG